jgi:ankyrin repeat protein
MSLTKAAQDGNLLEIQRLVNQRPKIGIYAGDDKALIAAAVNGHLSIVEFLVNHGINIHSRDDKALISATFDGHLSIVEYLINQGANIHAQDDQALIYAVLRGNISVVKFLLDHGANIHAQNDRALIVGLSNDHLLVVELLLRNGADISVLSPEDQALYQHWVPQTINPSEYYRVELSIIQIENSEGRSILHTKERTYILI